MYRIIIADDHQIVSEGLTRIIQEISQKGEPLGEVITSVHSLADCQQQCALQQPDLLLLDVAMKDGDGIESMAELRQSAPSMRIIILTSYAEPSVVQRAMTNGANGFMLKTAEISEFKDGLVRVMQGETFICQEAQPLYAAKNAEIKLTMREREVLALIVEGLTTKEIAAKLFLSSETVHSYTKTIREKLHVHNLAALVRVAYENHLVPGK